MYTNPSMVTVYDRDGYAGNSLRIPSGVFLYAAVDEQDRVYVASVDRENGKVVFRLCDLDGLNLKERVEFNVLNLTLEDPLVLLGFPLSRHARVCMSQEVVFYQSNTVINLTLYITIIGGVYTFLIQLYSYMGLCFMFYCLLCIN